MPDIVPAGVAGASALFGGPQEASNAGAGRGVPSSSGGAGLDIGALVKILSQGVDPKALSAGTSPVPVGHQLSMPSSMTAPIPQFQNAPMNNKQVIGKGNARAQGIGNAVTGVLNAIGSVTTAKAQQKQRQIAGVTTRLLQAQQAVDQATLTLKDDPNNADAKEAVQKNKQVMNDILADDKMRKAIEKGFDISFTDPSKNKTEEHAAVQKGIADAKKEAQTPSYADQFGSKMPTQMGVNPMAAQRLQILMQQNQAMQKMAATMLPKILTAQNSMERTKYIQSMTNMRQMQSQIFDMYKVQQQFQNNKVIKSIEHTYKLSEIYANAQAIGQKALELFQDEHTDPTVLFKDQTDFSEKMASAESRLTGARADITTTIAKIRESLSKETDSKRRVSLGESLKEAQDAAGSIQQQMDNLQAFKSRTFKAIKNLQESSVDRSTSGGGQSGGSGSSESKQPEPVGSSFDPSTLLYGAKFQYGGALPLAEPAEDSDEDSEDDDKEE